MTEITTAQPLWETHHPYYCAEGNYYARPADGLHSAYDSWADFHAEWGDADEDMNLVFRWDWQRSDPDDLDEGEEPEPDKLLVFWVLQRKAILRSTECVVTEADEPDVRKWLTERAKTVAAIWAPIDLAAVTP